MMDNDIILKRINFLANKAYDSKRYTYTDFLGMSEQETILSIMDDFSYVGYNFIGDNWENDNRERRIIRFGEAKALGYEEEIPITCIKCEPLQKKFSDELTHRDFLGAIINLGIERDVVGDIIVADNVAYFFVVNRMSKYIIDELTRVKRTSVSCKEVYERPKEASPRFEEIKLVVSSLRCDGVISKILKLSRSASILFFQQKKVYVNGKLIENNSQSISVNDIIAVRGFGKFIIGDEIRDTKKGRISISIKKYL